MQKGIGKMHAKWSPVSLATFYPDPEIKIDENIELTKHQMVAIRDCCPAKVFEVHEDVFEVANPQNCIFCGECKKMAEALDVNALKNFLRVGSSALTQARRRTATSSRSKPSAPSPPSPSSRSPWPSSAKSSRRSRRASSDPLHSLAQP